MVLTGIVENSVKVVDKKRLKPVINREIFRVNLSALQFKCLTMNLYIWLYLLYGAKKLRFSAQFPVPLFPEKWYDSIIIFHLGVHVCGDY